MSDEKPTPKRNKGGNPNWYKGMPKVPGSGQKPGQPRRLKRLDAIIGDLEVKLGRQCDPVVTLLELAAGHDELRARDVERWTQKQLDSLLALPGWRRKTDAELTTLGHDPDLAAAVKAVDVPRDVRLDAAKAASRFVRPILAQTEVSGPGGGPITTAAATFPVKELMGADSVVKFVEDLQIALAERAGAERDEDETNDVRPDEGD